MAAARCASDLFDPKRFAEKLAENLEYHNFVLTQHLGADPVDFQTVFDQAMADAEKSADGHRRLRRLYAINKAGGNLLFEGAQGTLLDIDHGTYPFVTSSNCVAGPGRGGFRRRPRPPALRARHHQGLLHRVGGGPFPTELDFETEGTPGYQMSTTTSAASSAP